MRDLSEIPDGLPIPTDDCACDHLKDAKLPAISLRMTSDRYLDMDKLKSPTVIFFILGPASHQSLPSRSGI